MFQSEELEKLRIILIDSELAFGSEMKQYASRHGVNLDYYPTMPQAEVINRYHAAIYVCDPSSMPDVEMNQFICTRFSQVPTLVVSDLNRKPTGAEIKRWRVRSFMLKDHGHEPIFYTVLGMIPSLDLSSRF